MAGNVSTIEFGTGDIEDTIANLSEADLDSLAFGAIQLDATGKILQYNMTEGEITGRDPKAAIGQNFFTDLAPCTNTPRFRGVFDEGVKAGKLNSLFEYTFDYNMNPTKVTVHIKKAIAGGTYWVFVKRM
jgi:photoactive yellow protein